MTKDRFDIHQHITNQIVTAIERGAGEFCLPWHRAAGAILRPVNVASKKAYQGVNILALWAESELRGLGSGLWGTYRQWAEAGAQVRKGEKAAYVIFYKEYEIAAADDAHGDLETRLFARATPVFAAELNRPEFSRRPRIALCAAVRTRRVIASRSACACG